MPLLTGRCNLGAVAVPCCHVCDDPLCDYIALHSAAGDAGGGVDFAGVVVGGADSPGGGLRELRLFHLWFAYGCLSGMRGRVDDGGNSPPGASAAVEWWATHCGMGDWVVRYDLDLWGIVVVVMGRGVSLDVRGAARGMSGGFCGWFVLAAGEGCCRIGDVYESRGKTTDKEPEFRF